MPQGHLTLPDYCVPGVRSLIALPETQARELVSQLRAEDPTYYTLRELSDRLASKTKIDPQIMRDIIRAVATLYTTRTIVSLSVPELVDAALQATEERELKPPEPEKWATFRTILTELLGLEGALAVAAKAGNVVTEQDKIFLRARVLTDIRPVFKEDPGEKPYAVAIIHTMKIHYQQGGALKSFFAAMDDRDLELLKDVLDRAQKKSATLKQLAASAKIPMIDIGGESET